MDNLRALNEDVRTLLCGFLSGGGTPGNRLICVRKHSAEPSVTHVYSTLILPRG